MVHPHSDGSEDGTSMGFSVDGGDVVTFTVPPRTTSATQHQLFYSSPVLSQGSHTLLIESTQSGGDIFFDYLMYDAAQASTAGKTLFVDDNESGIEYSPGWQLNTSEPYFMHTTHFSESPGSWVSIAFEGTLLSVYGPVTPGPGGEVYSAHAVIDGGSPILLPPPHLNLQLQPSPNTSFNTPLFTSPMLSQGKHTINFTVSSDSAIPLFVDYFLLQSGSNVTQQGGSFSTAAAASTSNSVFESATFTSESSRPSPTFSLPPKDPSSSDPHRLLAEIVGPVAALLVLLIAIFIGRQWTRRARRSATDATDSSYVLPLFTGPSAKGHFLMRVLPRLWSRQQDHGAQLQDSHLSTTMPVPFPTSVPETKSAHALNTILAPASPTGAATLQRNMSDEQADDAGSTFSCPPPSYVD
ncbi:hypothetical protein GGX14DRAFT_576533 [Mycena pura]|uniref:Transmembrane protein n=1 Tax=Mycena pura TaxID=153505 RepID=A0AAD6UXL3_9AGAR|nr:hypothetical protein GGX14DRAFT_576533 [Mycena pura]